MAEKSSAEAIVIRHGPKKGEGLDPERIPEIRKEGDVYFQRILSAPTDTIFFVVPSTVGRAQDTRKIIEGRVRELVDEHPEANIEIIPASEQKRIKKGAGKKYLISDMEPDPKLGFTDSDLYRPERGRLDKLFKGDEEYIGRTWAARASEIQELKADIQKKFPDLSDAELASIQPARMVETPEDRAINDLQAIVSSTEKVEKANPGHPLVGTFIGHAPRIDFLAMATLTEEINLKNFKRVQGLRNYLEASSFKVENGMIVEASFRGRSLAAPIAVSEVIARLQKASEERKAEWLKA